MSFMYMPISPVEQMTKSEARDLLEIPQNTRVIGVFGEHSRRKGTLEVIRAWPEKNEQEASLLLMGKLSDSIRSELQQRIEEIKDGRILVHDAVLDDTMFRAGFFASDVVTTLYPQHHGISGITAEAARSERPILGGTYGANGIIIKENGLGDTLDARDQAALRAALIKAVKEDPIVDLERRKHFIARHSSQAISESLRPWLGI